MPQRIENRFICLVKKQYGEPTAWDIGHIAFADVRRLLKELESCAVDPEQAAIHMIANHHAFHYLAVQILRELGRGRKLSCKGAKALLRSTPYTIAYYSGTERGHTLEENVGVLLTDKAYVPLVARFVQKCLLEKKNLRGWRRHAFEITRHIIDRWGESAVPLELKHTLLRHAWSEKNESRKQQFIDIVNTL